MRRASFTLHLSSSDKIPLITAFYRKPGAQMGGGLIPYLGVSAIRFDQAGNALA